MDPPRSGSRHRGHARRGPRHRLLAARLSLLRGASPGGPTDRRGEHLGRSRSGRRGAVDRRGERDRADGRRRRHRARQPQGGHGARRGVRGCPHAVGSPPTPWTVRCPARDVRRASALAVLQWIVAGALVVASFALEVDGRAGASWTIETVVGALCGCSAVTFERAAQELGLDYQGIDFDAAYRLDRCRLLGEAEVRPYFDTVDVDARVRTTAPSELLDQVVEVTERRCPVRNLLVDAGWRSRSTGAPSPPETLPSGGLDDADRQDRAGPDAPDLNRSGTVSPIAAKSAGGTEMPPGRGPRHRAYGRDRPWAGRGSWWRWPGRTVSRRSRW